MKKRIEVKLFANAMENELRENDHKGGWQNCEMGYLRRRLRQEVEELCRAVDEGRTKDILSEAADVANFAMMIADNSGVLEAE